MIVVVGCHLLHVQALKGSMVPMNFRSFADTWGMMRQESSNCSRLWRGLSSSRYKLLIIFFQTYFVPRHALTCPNSLSLPLSCLPWLHSLCLAPNISSTGFSSQTQPCLLVFFSKSPNNTPSLLFSPVPKSQPLNPNLHCLGQRASTLCPNCSNLPPSPQSHKIHSQTPCLDLLFPLPTDLIPPSPFKSNSFLLHADQMPEVGRKASRLEIDTTKWNRSSNATRYCSTMIRFTGQNVSCPVSHTSWCETRGDVVSPLSLLSQTCPW